MEKSENPSNFEYLEVNVSALQQLLLLQDTLMTVTEGTYSVLNQYQQELLNLLALLICQVKMISKGFDLKFVKMLKEFSQ